MHLSLPKQFPLFIVASSVCWSLQCLISALTQGGEGGHLFRLTCSVLLWGGRDSANKYHWRVWGVCAVSGPHWVCSRSWRVCFPRLPAQAPVCSAGELSEEGPGLRARPRSKLLRFRFSGSPQRHGLGWACVLSPSQVRAAQVTRWLASTLSPGVRCVLSPPSSQPLSFPGCAVGALSELGPVFPRSKPLRFSGTLQGHRLGWVCIIPFLGPSSSVLGEHTVPGGLCTLIISLVPAAWFPGCAVRILSQVC